jgi:PAS domain S-box-containing protein
MINIRTRKAAEQKLRGYQLELERNVRALQESEKRLSLIYDSVGDVLYYIRVEPDDCFRFVSVNDAFLKTTGLTNNQIVGKRIEELIPESSIQLVVDNYRKAIRENRIVRWEETSVYPSGEKIGDVSIAPVVDEEGICTHLVGSVHNVTESRQAVKALRESDERYRLAVAGSAAGIWDWDISSDKVFYSGRFKELLGYAAEETWSTTDDFWQRMHPDDAQAVRTALERHLEDRDPYREDFRLQTRSGEYRWFYARGQALWDKTGKPVRMAGSISDITERKAATEELQKSEGRFRSLMAQSPLAMQLLTPEGKIAQMNSAWMKLWGVDENGVAEIMKTYNFLEDDQVRDAEWLDLIKRGFAGENVVLPATEYSGQETVEELGIEKVNAKTVWIQCHLSPFRNDEQEIEYIVNTIVDVTDLKRSEEETHRQRELLSRMERTSSMGQLAGSIAHELNQPLTGMLSNAQAGEMLIKKGRYDHDELTIILSEIEADAKRASDVIRSLRDLYREQKGDFQLLDVNDVIDETAHLLHSELVINNVDLTMKCAPSVPRIFGNKVQIQQVLVNLIMNGSEAMKGMVPGDRRLHIATECDTGEFRVSVEDSGHGIDADKIDRIFEPLATWKPGGTGMGLAISNSIIQSHGGRMWAENRPGVGACVGFTLPLPNEGRQI